METARQRAVEEARRRRQAEWDGFRQREQYVRENGMITLADRRAAEALRDMRNDTRPFRGGKRRSPRRSPRRSRVRSLQTRRFNEAVRLGLLTLR